MDIGKYIRDLRRAVNDPESYWPINAADSLAGAGFTPADLFSGGEDGGWWEPADTATVFQERTGASATTAAGVGDPVGTILDKSGNGFHMIANSDLARPTLEQSGAIYYLLFDEAGLQVLDPLFLKRQIVGVR